MHWHVRGRPYYCAWCLTSIRCLSGYRQHDLELHDLENMSKLHQHMPGKVAGLSRCSRSAVAVVQSSPDRGTVHMYVGSQHEHHRRCKTSYSGFGASAPESFRRRIHVARWSWSRTGCGCRTPSGMCTSRHSATAACHSYPSAAGAPSQACTYRRGERTSGTPPIAGWGSGIPR